MFRVIKPTKQALDECLYHKTPKPFTHHPMWQTSAQAMHTLLQMYDFGEGWEFDNREQLAKQLGKNSNTLERHWKKLADAGLIRWSSGKLELYPFEDGSELPEVAVEQTPKQEKELSIAEEVAAKANRRPTGMSPADRWGAIKLAWNTHKPERYMQLDGGVNKPLLIAIETHTKRLGIDRDDYDTFIGAVLRGAKADSWWAERDFKATAVFGFGAELEDKKFQSVEKLYRAGLAGMPRVEKSSTFWSDDERVIAWYKSNVDGAPADMRVERIKVENDTEAQDLEDWHAFTVLGEPTRDTEVFLYRRLQALFTSGKLNYSAERFKGAARLYYQEGKPNPIWWTSRQTMPQPPTEN